MKKLFLSGLTILGFAALPTVVKAQQSMPEGYTQSPTVISGKHCYYHGGNHANYYCYNHKLEGSAIQSNSTNNSSPSTQQPNSTDNSSPSTQYSPTNSNGSSVQQPNTNNSGSSNPSSAQKTPSNSIKPGNVVNSTRSRQGGGGTK